MKHLLLIQIASTRVRFPALRIRRSRGKVPTNTDGPRILLTLSFASMFSYWGASSKNALNVESNMPPPPSGLSLGSGKQRPTSGCPSHAQSIVSFPFYLYICRGTCYSLNGFWGKTFPVFVGHLAALNLFNFSCFTLVFWIVTFCKLLVWKRSSERTSFFKLFGNLFVCLLVYLIMWLRLVNSKNTIYWFI